MTNVEDFYKNFPFRQSEQYMREQLIRMTCPIMCKGYSTDPERWHDLCIARAEEALKVIRGINVVDDKA